MLIRGSPPIVFGTGVPSKPTRSTSTPDAASARAWYSMRALRPRSPSATTAALMRERGGFCCTEVEREAALLRSTSTSRSTSDSRTCPPEQVGRDTAPIHGRGADVVDGRDLLGQDAECDVERAGRRQAPPRSVSRARPSARRCRTRRERLRARSSRGLEARGHHDLRRSPGPRASRLSGTHCRPRKTGISTPAISSSGRRTVAR